MPEIPREKHLRHNYRFRFLKACLQRNSAREAEMSHRNYRCTPSSPSDPACNLVGQKQCGRVAGRTESRCFLVISSVFLGYKVPLLSYNSWCVWKLLLLRGDITFGTKRVIKIIYILKECTFSPTTSYTNSPHSQVLINSQIYRFLWSSVGNTNSIALPNTSNPFLMEGTNEESPCLQVYYLIPTRFSELHCFR